MQMSSTDTRVPRSRRAPPQDDTTGPGENKFLLWALIVWFLVTFVRVQDMLPFLKVLAPGMLATLSVTFAMLSRLRQVRWSDPIVKAFMVMLFGICTGVFYALNTFWLFTCFVNMLTYGIVFLMAMPLLLRSPYCTRIINKTLAASMFVTAVWSVFHAGHGQGAWLGDENDVALFLNIGVCFCYFAARGARTPGERRFLLLTAAVCAAGTVFSFSRGGFVGLAVGVVAIGVYSRKLLKVLSVATLIGLLILPILATLQPPAGRGKSRTYLEELTSINDKNDSTRLERLYTWTGGWVMFKANPVFGIGAGNYSFALGHYESNPQLQALNTFGRSFAGRAAHSLYFTLLPELGGVGTVSFLVMWFAVLRRTWKESRDVDSVLPKGMAAGIGASLLSYAACSAFVSAFYYPPFWLLCGFACRMYAPATKEQTRVRNRGAEQRPAQVAQPPPTQALPVNRR
jgi:O-antigen ligase